MRTLYFDCFAGASGDMILGALIDVGLDVEALKVELRKLKIPEFDLQIDRVDRSGIASTHLKVIVPDAKKHRHLRDIEAIIDGSPLSENVKTRSRSIFRRLAEAEAKVHGIDVASVHFHEVGALDAIVDIVGACIGFEQLGIENFVCSKINVGNGFVGMEHGNFPVPPPAVAELLTGIPVFGGHVEGEMTTPTGAAIISTLANSYGTMPEIKVEQTGYGAGTRSYEGFPNTLRVFIGESAVQTASIAEAKRTDDLVLLETNIDDSTPQTVGFLMERALAKGANDCWVTPIHMKKNRPAFTISILCISDLKAPMLELLYSETSTIGIRSSTVERDALDRERVSVSTRFGKIDVKIAKLNGRIVNSMPEYEDVRSAAIEHNAAFDVVRNEAINALNASAAAAAK